MHADMRHATHFCVGEMRVRTTLSTIRSRQEICLRGHASAIRHDHHCQTALRTREAKELAPGTLHARKHLRRRKVLLVSWHAHRPRSDKRQDAAELSIGPCALVSRDILLIGTVHAAGKSQESRGVSHGSQPANNSDRLNIGGPHQWLGGGLDRACRAWQGMAKGTHTLLAILLLGHAERSIA